MLKLIAYHYYDDDASKWRTGICTFDEDTPSFEDTITQWFNPYYEDDVIYFFLEVKV